MSRARPRARPSVAPGFQELVEPADAPSTRRAGYWGPRRRRSRHRSCLTALAPCQPLVARGRRPAQVKRLLPATLPSSLWPPGPCLCVRGGSPPVGDITPRIAWRGTAAETGGDVPGHRRHRRSHSPGTVKLPPPSRLQPACGGDREQRGPSSQWQPGPAGKPPITERRTHLRGRARRRQGEGRGRVRGGTPRSSIGQPELVSEAPPGVLTTCSPEIGAQAASS